MMKPKNLPTNRIAQIRSAKGLTQQAVADLVGSHWITISKLERGKMRLTDEWLLKLAEALGVDENELLPADRVLTTLSIQGEIFPGGELLYYGEDDPHTNTIYNSLFHNDGLSWFYVNTDAMLPLFHDGDTIGFRMAWGLSPDDFFGRLCIFWIGPGNKTVVGRISQRGPDEKTGRRYSITTVGDETIKDALVFNFAVMKIVIADHRMQFEDETPPFEET